MDRTSYSIGRLKAPAHDGEILAVPVLNQCISLAEQNSRLLTRKDISLLGRPLPEFRNWARSVLLKRAREYLDSLQRPVPATVQDRDGLLFVTGHQPVLSHPGVWAKNLALGRLSQAGSGIGLNLIVDNDTAGRMSIDLPAGTVDQPGFQAIEFDQPGPERPWEEISVLNESLFKSFADRVTAALAEWGLQPELSEIWPAVVSRLNDDRGMSSLLTLARLQMERKRGVQNLELPVSLLSDSEPFQQFFMYILQQAERFLHVYNESLTEYRQEYRLHSNRHPVPDLERRGEWIELPFWVWKTGDVNRSRLYVRTQAGSIELSSGTEQVWTLSGHTGQQPLTSNGAAGILEQLRQMQSTWKLRPRALTLTLFTRLALADLFIHGIGGAKYDEVTDRIIGKFFQISPPSYSVVTATMHLPQAEIVVSEDDIQQLRHQLRDMKYNPHAYLPADEVQELVNVRNELLESAGQSREETPAVRRKHHQRLVSIRETLFQRVQGQREQLQQKLRKSEQLHAAARILKFREFPTVLFSSARLDALWHTIDSLSRPE